MRSGNQTILTKVEFSDHPNNAYLFHAKLAKRAKDFLSALSRGQEAEYEWFFQKNNVEFCTLIILLSPIDLSLSFLYKLSAANVTSYFLTCFFAFLGDLGELCVRKK
jgi:hypothetical protein